MNVWYTANSDRNFRFETTCDDSEEADSCKNEWLELNNDALSTVLTLDDDSDTQYNFDFASLSNIACVDFSDACYVGYFVEYTNTKASAGLLGGNEKQTYTTPIFIGVGSDNTPEWPYSHLVKKDPVYNMEDWLDNLSDLDALLPVNIFGFEVEDQECAIGLLENFSTEGCDSPAPSCTLEDSQYCLKEAALSICLTALLNIKDERILWNGTAYKFNPFAPNSRYTSVSEYWQPARRGFEDESVSAWGSIIYCGQIIFTNL